MSVLSAKVIAAFAADLKISPTAAVHLMRDTTPDVRRAVANRYRVSSKVDVFPIRLALAEDQEAA